jgi:hypothetical protein
LPLGPIAMALRSAEHSPHGSNPEREVNG